MDGESVLLCRYGELFLKSGNRKRFQSMLVSNVQAAVAGVPGAHVQAPHGRILVRVPAVHVDEAAARTTIAGGHAGTGSNAVTEEAALIEGVTLTQSAAVTGEEFHLVTPFTLKNDCRTRTPGCG